MVSKGATALAEGGRRFKVDVDLIFNHLKATDRKYILRTVFDPLSVWKSKYAESNISPYKSRHENKSKDCAIIDGEVWVFGVDATNSHDIVTAIEIAKGYYKVGASTFLSDIYIKNLNAENENIMGQKALIDANKSLYKKTCDAIRQAASTLAYRGELRLHVFSNNRNPKIPGVDLHSALMEGQARSIESDPARYSYQVSKNDNSQDPNLKPLFTHHHMAIFDL